MLGHLICVSVVSAAMISNFEPHVDEVVLPSGEIVHLTYLRRHPNLGALESLRLVVCGD